jgi:hydroxyacylglutathione hydrolase
MINIEPISAFNDNYIWLLHDASVAWVVDPGDASVVVDAIERIGKPLGGILLTHHHFDHTGGVGELVNRYQPKVFGPANPAINDVNTRLKQGDSVDVMGVQFDILEVPGHTLDHIAYYAPNYQPEPLLFCGDTLFAGGCGRIFEGTAPMMFASLQQLAALPALTRVFCAHEYTLANLAFAAAVEPSAAAIRDRISRDQGRRKQGLPTVPSQLGEELQTNPFLRCSQSSVTAAATRRAGRPLPDDEAVFAEIRAWKNDF